MNINLVFVYITVYMQCQTQSLIPTCNIYICKVDSLTIITPKKTYKILRKSSCSQKAFFGRTFHRTINRGPTKVYIQYSMTCLSTLPSIQVSEALYVIRRPTDIFLGAQGPHGPVRTDKGPIYFDWRGNGVVLLASLGSRSTARWSSDRPLAVTLPCLGLEPWPHYTQFFISNFAQV